MTRVFATLAAVALLLAATPALGLADDPMRSAPADARANA